MFGGNAEFHCRLNSEAAEHFETWGEGAREGAREGGREGGRGGGGLISPQAKCMPLLIFFPNCPLRSSLA